MEDNGLKFSKISKTLIQRKKSSLRVKQKLSWPPMSFDMYDTRRRWPRSLPPSENEAAGLFE